jgi:hypothetical protein
MKEIFADHESYLKTTPLHKYLREMVIDYLIYIPLKLLDINKNIFTKVEKRNSYCKNIFNNIKRIYYFSYQPSTRIFVEQFIIVAQLKNCKYIYFECIFHDDFQLNIKKNIDFYIAPTLTELKKKINS